MLAGIVLFVIGIIVWASDDSKFWLWVTALVQTWFTWVCLRLAVEFLPFPRLVPYFGWLSKWTRGIINVVCTRSFVLLFAFFCGSFSHLLKIGSQ